MVGMVKGNLLFSLESYFIGYPTFSLVLQPFFGMMLDLVSGRIDGWEFALELLFPSLSLSLDGGDLYVQFVYFFSEILVSRNPK